MKRAWKFIIEKLPLVAIIYNSGIAFRIYYLMILFYYQKQMRIPLHSILLMKYNELLSLAW